ncbi:MAG: 2-(1,2-epoxy-1,2-dihydrophenyl)acetyl-CoA isomerase [Gammaproteobacteria bacterium]|nr:2-(1,2-epoxy-1,2-dihydrophenyl)acetyl-CoA isomerase [Gammaproteobacteria bacterium]
MEYRNILYSSADGVATLTLNRPHSLNSFTSDMHAELRDAMEQVKSDPKVRCLLLTGAGRGFCAGQDLSDRAVVPGEHTPDIGDSLEKNYNPLVRAITRLPKPVVCAVNGVAAGAGANIALCCDIVLAARSAVFLQGFSKIGLIPDAGGSWTLPRLVGRARAMGLALLGEKITADQALAWGMIWQVIDDDRLIDESTMLAAWLATQPTKGLGLTKQALNASGGNTLEQQLELERKLQSIAGASNDYRAGVTAFLQKRTPQFNGD